ncbi:MAG: hypothetical protein V4685_13365, partial [Bacteroidota bacterium]
MKSIKIAFILSTLLVAIQHSAYGQKSDQDKVYLVLFYVKPLPALHHQYIKAENEIFRPIHQAVVNAGNMISCAVYWVETSSTYTRDYDFVVVKAYKNIHDLDANTPDSFFSSVHMGKDWDSLMRSGFLTRESPRREIWVVDKQFAKEMTGQLTTAKLIVNFNNKPIDETSLYTPLIKDSTIKNWESYSLLLPQGAKYP